MPTKPKACSCCGQIPIIDKYNFINVCAATCICGRRSAFFRNEADAIADWNKNLAVKDGEE